MCEQKKDKAANTGKDGEKDMIEDYYKNCKRTASYAIVTAGVSAILALAVIIAAIVISFFVPVSLLQICLFLFLVLILLGIAGTSVFLYVLHMKKQKEYAEYMKEQQEFSSCEEIVGQIEKSEDRDQMRTYIIKARMSRFR